MPGLTGRTSTQVVDFVSTGGYALKTYERFAKIGRARTALWRVRNAAHRPAATA